MNENLKYEYCVYAWGGFFNDEYKCDHGFSEGAKFFSSLEDADCYERALRHTCDRMKASMLVTRRWEGFSCRVPVILNRVIEFGGKMYHSEHDMAPCRDYEAAKYHLENKWYPGFNDEIFGEDFDYSKVKVISEWISGSFDVNGDV